MSIWIRETDHLIIKINYLILLLALIGDTLLFSGKGEKILLFC